MSYWYIRLNDQQAMEISNRPERFISTFRRAAQYRIQLALYRAERGTPEHDRLNAAYERFVQYALKVNPNGHVAEIDPDLHEFYTNIFKSENGIKPRWFVGYREARDYCTRMCEAQKEAA